MRFQRMLYVRPAKAPTSLRARTRSMMSLATGRTALEFLSLTGGCTGLSESECNIVGNHMWLLKCH